MFRNHTRTYYRQLASYSAILLLTVFALVIFSQAFFVVQLRDSLTQSHRSRLRQTVAQLDSDLQQIYVMDYQISSANENFLSYYLDDPSPMRDLRIVNEFKNLLAPSTFISEIALVAQDADSVYTSKAVYAKQMFFERIYAFADWPDPIGDLSRLSGRLVRPAERVNGGTRYVTFINLPSVFSRLQDAAQLYFVDESHLLSRLSPESAPTQQGAIWDAEGRLIAATLPLTKGVTGDRLRFDGVDYLVLREASDVLDWTYTFLLPEGEFMAPIRRAQVVLMVFVVVLLSGGALLIHYAMQVNYKPILELTRSLGAAPGLDDLESLRDVIGSLSAQNESMRAQLMCTPDGQGLKDTLLFSLLKGKFESFEAFNTEAKPLGITFDKPWYQVLLLRHFGQDEEVPRPVLAAALDKALGDGFTCHFRELFEPSMIVCLVGMDEGMDAELYTRCQQLLTDCMADHGLSFTIGMSGCYQDIDRITTACFEASQAVREHFIRGRHQVIRYHDLDQTVSHASALLADVQALPTQPPQQQEQTLRHLVDTLKSNKVPALLAKSYCNSAAQLLITANNRPVNMDDLFNISYLRTADDYLSFMLHLIQADPEAPSEEAASDESPETELLSRIRAYVAEHYDDCNFSLQEAANGLSLSSSYLSQYFKQQTGDTLTSYVADLRIRKACALLEGTAMPLQMVSESVGYYNQNSFIRRFKQMMGVTPGEYRRSHQ